MVHEAKAIMARSLPSWFWAKQCAALAVQAPQYSGLARILHDLRSAVVDCVRYWSRMVCSRCTELQVDQ